jgi:hypothetical protein
VLAEVWPVGDFNPELRITALSYPGLLLHPETAHQQEAVSKS